MDITATKNILVGTNPKPVAIGETVEGVDDAEGKALIAMGFAVEATKGKGGAPENKAKGGKADPFEALLTGSVADITAKLDTFNAHELRAIRDLEASGQNRKGVADAIAQYDLGE